ncbi:MAG: response regulator [Vicinamibacterales bacterium]
MAGPLRVLIVDDAGDHAEMVREMVRFAGAWPDAEVDKAGSYAAALEALSAKPYDLAFFDYWLGSEDGLALIREVRQQGIQTPVIVLTGHGAEETAVEAMKAGAADYLSKTNLSVDAVARAMRHALALAAGAAQQRAAEHALRASEERFRALVENSWEVLLLLDADGRLTYMTPSVERLFGWRMPSMLGQALVDFLHPEDQRHVAQRLSSTIARPGERLMTEARIRHADGTYRSVDAVVVSRLHEPAVNGIVFNARDITEGRRLEEQLRQAQKMEAVGRLAGGVAHDFNNLLTAILGYCNLALDDLPEDDPSRADLVEIKEAGERAATLTRQLLAFSRRQMLQPEPLDLNALIQQMEKMVRRVVGEDIELVTALGDGLPEVLADPASIEQIVVSLAMNARDAMPDGGRLVIETMVAELDDLYADSHATVLPGPYVLLAVTDNGEGMDAATRARVFEPFFTTKPQGKGVGLGLATVYGIVKQTGGYIWVYSEPHYGTVFKVYLPLAGAHPVAATDARVPDTRKAAETILLVEDEESVRALTGEVLRRQGYDVLEAEHGLAALKIVESCEAPIHLLLTDIVMPHMNGRDLAEQIAAVRPGTKVLFMSGYTDHAAVHRELSAGAPFLQKPFTPDALAKKVRGLLDGPGGA